MVDQKFIKTYRVYIQHFDDGTFGGYIACPGVPALEEHRLYGTFNNFEEIQNFLDQSEASGIFHVINISAYACSRLYRSQLDNAIKDMKKLNTDHLVADLRHKNELH